MKRRIVRCNNSDVTDFYLDIVDEACEKCKSSETIAITARTRDAIAAKKNGENVIFWAQGITPEESYMKHHSKIRRLILSYYEKKALKSADFVLFVSDYMKEHYEKKYHLDFSDGSYYVIPCFNSNIREASFYSEGKYTGNVFTYIGSMSPWQGFDNVIESFKRIEKVVSNAFLEVYTGEQDIAKEMLEKAGISNYTIGYVQNSRIFEVLEKAKFGFILREDNEVNRVATPTKISTYMAHGVIPIYSESLRSFSKEAKKLKYVVSEQALLENVNKLVNKAPDPNEVYNEYSGVFDTYFSRDFHIQNLCEILEKKFK